MTSQRRLERDLRQTFRSGFAQMGHCGVAQSEFPRARPPLSCICCRDRNRGTNATGPAHRSPFVITSSGLLERQILPHLGQIPSQQKGSGTDNKDILFRAIITMSIQLLLTSLNTLPMIQTLLPFATE
jgi:hypothetical protein